MSKRLKRGLLFVGSAALIVICTLLAFRSGGARYQGRTITSWVREDLFWHSASSNVVAALNEFPAETTKIIVRVLRENIHGTQRDWWNGWVQGLPSRVRVHLPRIIDPFEARAYFRSQVKLGLTGHGLLYDAWVSALIAMMNDPDPLLRAEAGAAFAQTELDMQHWDHHDQINTALVQACQDPDGQVRWNAIRNLGKIRPVTDAAVAILVKSCAEPSIRRGAALALAEMKREPACAVPILIEEGLRDPAPAVRAGFLGAVGSYGSNAAFAIPQLEAALKDRDEEVRTAVKKALQSLQPVTVPR